MSLEPLSEKRPRKLAVKSYVTYSCEYCGRERVAINLGFPCSSCGSLQFKVQTHHLGDTRQPFAKDNRQHGGI